MRLPYARSRSRPVSKEPESTTVGGFVRLVVTVLLLAWVVRSLIVAPFSIPSGSMLPSLYIGDYIFVPKWSYGYSRYSFPLGIPSFNDRVLGDVPDRGDIVVFRAPDGEADIVKRAIGLPGDTVEVRGGMLILNGQAVPREAAGFIEIPVTPNSPCRVAPGATPQLGGDERSCRYPAYRETLPDGTSWLVIDQVDNPQADDVPAVVVPHGHVFLMGDNRDDSLDSRFPPLVGGIGFVPVENLIGRGSFIFWSTDGSAEYLKPWTWFSALRASRIGPVESATTP